MKLVIFSEAGFEYGFGHFYRMSGICEKAIKDYGEAEMYLVADETARDNLKREYVRFADWHDASEYERILDKESTLVVDSYHVDLAELERFQELAREMIVIDDNIRLDYHDMKILNPNYFAMWIDYPQDSNNTVYSGKECTLLRDEFRIRENRVVRKDISNILVTMGGTDPKGLTQEIIRRIKSIDTISPQATIHAVCTEAYKNLNEIRQEMGPGDKLHLNAGASEVRDLMLKCDFAVASAGGTTNELIKMQCPAVLVAVADNQMVNTRLLSEKGYVLAAYGDKLDVIESICDYNIRQSIAKKLKEFETDRSGKDIICEIAFRRS